MPSVLLQCPSEGSECLVYPFVGFVNPNNRYRSVTICDWDCCLYGVGTTSDSVYVPGYGTLYQPAPPLDPNCITGHNIACNPYPPPKCTIDEDGNNVVLSTWDGKVDGHIVYQAINSCYVKITEATGSLAQYNPVGSIIQFSNNNIFEVLGTVQNDQYAYSSIENAACGNPDASRIFFVLGDPSPFNT